MHKTSFSGKVKLPSVWKKYLTHATYEFNSYIHTNLYSAKNRENESEVLNIQAPRKMRLKWCARITSKNEFSVIKMIKMITAVTKVSTNILL